MSGFFAYFAYFAVPSSFCIRVYLFGAIYENSAFSTKYFPLCFLCFLLFRFFAYFAYFAVTSSFCIRVYLFGAIYENSAFSTKYFPLYFLFLFRFFGCGLPRQVFRGSRNCLGGDLGLPKNLVYGGQCQDAPQKKSFPKKDCAKTKHPT